MDTVSGRAVPDGLSSDDQAATRLHPAGFDPSRTTPWLHLRGQFSYHGEALITGNVAGLTALRDALDAAICARDAEAEVFASDGEGYIVTVRRTTRLRDMGNPPYIDEIAREAADFERQFLKRHEKYNRDLWRDRWEQHRRDSDAGSAEDAGTAAEPRSGSSAGPQDIAQHEYPKSERGKDGEKR